MNKVLLRLSFLMIIFTYLLGCDVMHDLIFMNKYTRDIYVIVDLNSIDNKISSRSEVLRIPSKSTGRTSRLSSWGHYMKDSMHVYVLDAYLVDKAQPLNTTYITDEQTNALEPDMILSRITILESSLYHRSNTVYISP